MGIPPTSAGRWSTWGKKTLTVFLALVLLGGTVCAAWLLPPLIAAGDLQLIPGAPTPNAEEPRATAEDVQAARQAMLWVAGGLIATVTLTFTWFRDRDNRAKLQLDRDANYTSRYTEAIAQLGHEEATIRMGGIHALERLARDSESDRPTIVRVLCSFYRSKSPAPESPSDRAPARRLLAVDLSAAIEALLRLSELLPSVSRLIDLSHSDLSGANLRGARLEGASLRNTHLARCSMERANLNGADLGVANLTGAYLLSTSFNGSSLSHADLTGAYLLNTNLANANLAHANLTDANLYEAKLIAANVNRADLTNAKLTNANLYDAKLVEANLRNANLTGAKLTNANLTNAVLTGAILTDVILTNANLTGAIIPRE